MQSNNRTIFNVGIKPNLASSVIEKPKVQIIVEILEYMPNKAISKTIIKKLSEDVSISSVSENGESKEKAASYDTFIQIIDGSAEVIINKKAYQLVVGDGIVAPANAVFRICSHEKFIMITTVKATVNE